MLTDKTTRVKRKLKRFGILFMNTPQRWAM